MNSENLHQYEGIILNKTPFKERHLVSRVLLKNGKKISVNFLGGQGGGKKMKSSVVQLGHGIRFSLTGKLKEGDQLNLCKDFKPLWSPQKIRDNHRAFYLMCFFLEFLDKISLTEDLQSRTRLQQINFEDLGLYNVLSNSLFFMDEALQSGEFNSHKFLSIFFAKLVFQLGLTPNLEIEYFSEIPLVKVPCIQLSFENGAFIDGDKVEVQERMDHKDVWEFLKACWNFKFKDHKNIPEIDANVPNVLLSYLFFQLGFSKSDFRSLELVL